MELKACPRPPCTPWHILPGWIHSMELKANGQAGRGDICKTRGGIHSMELKGDVIKGQKFLVLKLWESIQWNWKSLLLLGKPPRRACRIHSMELKAGAPLPSTSTSNTAKESIQWNWKSSSRKHTSCWPCRIRIHSMELKVKLRGWYHSTKFQLRIHSMELKASKLC